MSDRRIQLLADEIFTKLEGTIEGHCVRVDFLEREDALRICQYMTLQRQQQVSDLIVRVLASRNQEIVDSMYITTDKAVEIRNRKRGRLCLFVPSDLVDAAYSSLANSFALINGQTLFESALKKEVRKLSRDAQRAVSFVGQGMLRASYEQRLDFAVTAQIQSDDELLGLELWRIGLISDARPDFVAHLTSNRNGTILLSHPTRPDATARERIQSLKVDKETANALGRFFRNRSMNDVSSWSYELASDQTLTFDHWIFPDKDHSDIKKVTIQSFINAHGVVERFSRLTQPDEANGSLQAICGPKGTMVVKWACDPPQPQNLSGWSVRIVPSDYDYELAEDSDFIEPKIPRVPASRRTVTVKLDMEEDEIPTGPVCVRVAPLDATGNELVDKETEEVIADKSTEFFLARNLQPDMPGEVRENRSIVPTLSYGRLETAIKLPEGQTFIEEQALAQWISRDLFSLTLSNKTILNVSVSETLIELERQVRDNPRDGGCFTLAVDEVIPVEVSNITPYPLQSGSNATWSAFWKARETFFSRLKKQPSRDTIETADWTPELANAAIRYAQEYQKLLDSLIKNRCEREEMLEILSIDSLLVQVAGKGDEVEEAVVILPTHPLRVAWMVSYTQLLRHWEELLLAKPKGKRKNSMDLDALRMLTPTNVPAFAYHTASKNAFLFFQNIRLYHGVALPANIADPRRHYTNVSHILGSGFGQSGIGDIRPNHLKEHLERFSETHPYTRTLVITLVNPDRGDFFAEAVRLFLDETTRPDEQGETRIAQELASDMTLQMESSAQAMQNRFFNERRVDGTLQRSYLANVLKFYFERSRRYKLIDPDIERPFLERLARLEKTGLKFRPTYEGYIVNLEGQHRNKPIEIDAQPEKAKITVLTANDFYNANTPEFSLLLNPSASVNIDEAQPIYVEDQEWVDSEVEQDTTLNYLSSFDKTDDDSFLTTSTEKLSASPNDMPSEDVIVPLGESADDPVEWKPSTKGSPHLFIIGIPGQGKSWTTTRILNELGKQLIPTLVLDFHGQFTDPHGSFMRTIHPSVVDAARGLPFSPFECNLGNDSGSWKANSYALAEIFAYVTNMGQMQRDIIYTALQDAYKAHGFTDDEEEEMVDLDYPTSEEVLRRIERKEQERHISNVAARCRPLLEMNLFRPLKDATDMLTSIRRGLVIDLHNLFAEELQVAGGAFVLRKLYRDMFRWGNTDRLRLAIVLDEAHRLAKDITLPKLMKEGRKFGIAVIVASQGINDFHQDILSNAGTKVIFRVNYPDSKKVAGFIRGRAGLDLAARIEQLQVGSAFVQTPEMPFGSLVRMYPLE